MPTTRQPSNIQDAGVNFQEWIQRYYENLAAQQQSVYEGQQYNVPFIAGTETVTGTVVSSGPTKVPSSGDDGSSEDFEV